MKVKRDFTVKSKPDMLPLIDVVFLLLVFFIYAMLSMSYHNGIRLELPGSTQAVHMIETVELVVSIDESGQAYIGKEAIDLESLGGEVVRFFEEKDASQEKPCERQVILSGHKSLSYQKLFRVMDTLRQSGITTISLQAESIAS